MPDNNSAAWRSKTPRDTSLQAHRAEGLEPQRACRRSRRSRPGDTSLQAQPKVSAVRGIAQQNPERLTLQLTTTNHN